MLKKADQKEFLMEVYSQCNEHIRAQPQKRDQIILFYVAVCSFYLSQYQEGGAMFYIMTGALMILGAICAVIVVSLRAWIVQYTRCAEIIGKLLMSPDELCENQITRFIEDQFLAIPKQSTPFALRTGNLISLAFCFVTLTPFATLFAQIVSNHPIFAIFIVIAALLYFSALAFFCWHKVTKASAINANTWIVRFQTIQAESNTCAKKFSSET